MKLKSGMQAPRFALQSQDGKQFSLERIRANYTILFFYPKDDTPGCTIEAKEFSSHLNQFKKIHTEVFGISGLSAESKKKFCDKYNLKINLLADSDFKVSKLYGVYGEKSFLGKKFMGISRTTFLLDKNKQIIRVYEKVKPAGHASAVLEDIKYMMK